MFNLKRKVLFGLSVSMVLAMAIGSFALSESQTPANPQEVEAQSAVGATVGAFTVNGGTQGTDYDYASSVLTIYSGNLTVSTTAQTAERIVVDGAATITLAGVNIDRSSETEATAPITIADNAAFNVNILLADGSNNTLKGRTGSSDANPGSPGIRKNGEGDNIGKLTIGVPDGAAGTGKLTVTGGYCGAGIGGGYNGSGSNITISGGVVTAYGGRYAAGIGGGERGNGSDITINGGEVTANGGSYAAGIGGGSDGSGSNIKITGGEVTATGGEWGAGIGGGRFRNGSYITIIGGKVTATGGNAGAGIGGAYGGEGSYITISGGEVTANAGENVAAGIGSSGSAHGTTIGDHIKISGGIVKAYGTAFGSHSGAGIGGVWYNTEPGSSNNELDGDAVVLAVSGDARIDALDGFVNEQGTSLLTKGIAFTRQTTSGTWNSAMYGNVTLSQDLEIPTNLTVPAGQILSIEEGKDVTLSEETGVKYTVEGELRNNGTVTLPADLAFSGNGKVTTKTDFYLDDGSLYNTGYQTYRTSAGVQKYTNLPNPYQLDPSNGKRFINWYYLNQAGQEVEISENVNVLLNEHSFHENSIEQFTVTFSVPTGTAPAAQTLDTGGKATDPQLIWANGTVEGWYTDQAFTPANKWNFGTDTVTGNITLHAKFQCTVTFDPNYSGGSEVTSQTVVYNNTVPEPDEPTRDGYSVDGWYKEAECTNLWDFENDRAQGDMTLYAKWIVAEHKVIIPSNPDDHGTVTTDPDNPKTGDEVIITVTPEEGYEIDGLPIVKTEDGRIIEVVPTGNPNEYKFIMPDSDVTIEVHFVRISEPEVKTGDSFTGIAALAILGLATTGAVLVRKHK